MISLIIPVYNNELTLNEFYEKMTLVLKKNEQNYEMIFVDDASQDRSFRILEALHQRDRRIKIIKLKKNFGQSFALLVIAIVVILIRVIHG